MSLRLAIDLETIGFEAYKMYNKNVYQQSSFSGKNAAVDKCNEIVWVMEAWSNTAYPWNSLRDVAQKNMGQYISNSVVPFHFAGPGIKFEENERVNVVRMFDSEWSIWNNNKKLRSLLSV